MALPGRTPRRASAGFRWLGVGLAATLLILLIDASLHSRSPGPGQQLAAGAWIDRVLPIVTTSTVEGRVISGIWAGGLTMPGPEISSQLQQVATEAAQNYDRVLKLRAPVTLGGPAGLLEACLYSRKQAAAAMVSAFSSVLGASTAAGGKAPPVDPAAAARSVQAAGNDMQIGDQTYALFTQSMPAELGVKMPPSAWFSNPAPYQAQTASVFFASLRNAVNPNPVHQVRIYSVTTNPAAVSTEGAVRILPDATAILLTIVVADVGNQAEDNLKVTASISPAANGSSSVRDFVNLTPGQSYSIVGLGPLDPPQGVPVTLTVTVDPPAGSATPPASETLTFQMPAPPPPSTTTSTTAPTTSTT